MLVAVVVAVTMAVRLEVVVLAVVVLVVLQQYRQVPLVRQEQQILVEAVEAVEAAYSSLRQSRWVHVDEHSAMEVA